MIPIPYTYQQMLKKYIPIFTYEKFDDNKNLLALRDESRHELYMIPKKYFPKKDERNKEKSERNKEKDEQDKGKFAEYYQGKIEIIKVQIKNDTVKATQIIKPYEKSYNAAHRLWIAQREYAMEHGNLLQVPISITYVRRFVFKAIHYRIVEVQTLPILLINKIKYHLQLLFNINNKKELNNEQ